jgi:hypothetical protein
MNYNNNISLVRNYTVIHTVITIKEVTKAENVTPHHKLQQEKNIMENILLQTTNCTDESSGHVFLWFTDYVNSACH